MKIIKKDTLQIKLANACGKWYGKGIYIYSYILSYSSSVSYPKKGKYTYTISQGMKENSIKGISNIGLRILKKGIPKQSNFSIKNQK